MQAKIKLFLLMSGIILFGYGEGQMLTNPLLIQQELPLFGEIKPEHFEPAIEYAIADYKKTLQQVLNQTTPTFDNTIDPLEEASNKIDQVWNVIRHLNLVQNAEEIRKAYEKALPKIVEFSSEIMQNKELYQAYLKIKESKDFNKLNQAQQIIVNHAIRDFKLAGVNLPQDQQDQVKVIKQQLSDLSNQFSKNILDATQAWNYHVTPENSALLTGLPEHTIALAKEKAGKDRKSGWILTLDAPCYIAVMSYAKDRNLREKFYTAYATRASDQGPMAGKWDNTEVINKILALRQELIELLGYNNYAEYSLVPKMAENTKQVMDFLHDLAQRSRPIAIKEFEELKQFAKQQDNLDQLYAWDIGYYSELYQQTHYKISQEELRPYFPEQQVFSGLFKLTEDLFGMQVEEIKDFPKWHDAVKLYAVKDQNGVLRGKFYVDLYTRNLKKSGAWMSDLKSRFRDKENKLHTPIAFLVADLTPSVNNNPALLSHDEIDTIFHEFGHVLQHILTQVDYLSVSGTNGVARDAVELPSQFMENWCWEWEVIKKLSAHYQTGEFLPKEKFDNLLATKNFNAALHMLRQLELAIFDFRLHLREEIDKGRTPQQILDQVRQEITVIPVPEFNRFQHSFSHIFDGGYAAGYFSYKWAEVLSSDAFEYFKENDTFNREIGRKFLTTILEQGGAKEAMDLFVEFRGRKPTIDALLKHNGIIK